MSRVLRALGVVAVLSVICGLIAAGSAVAADPDPMAGAPEVGACYDLTLRQAYQDSTSKATVDCSAKHTLLVGAVGELPADFDWTSSHDRYTWTNKICDPFWEQYYSSEKPASYRTLLAGYWLMPTQAQRDAGARWVSCSIGVATDRALLRIPAAGPAKYSANPARSIARCATARYQTVACSSRHAWRATYAFGVRATGSNKAVMRTINARASRTCPRHVTSKRGLYSYRPIARHKYAIACFSQTRR